MLGRHNPQNHIVFGQYRVCSHRHTVRYGFNLLPDDLDVLEEPAAGYTLSFAETPDRLLLV
jgi:hypothetical protein